jgi:methylglutaconyl-CoA hydratase
MVRDPSRTEPLLVLFEEQGLIAILTLNRAAKRNALSRALIDTLSDAFSRLALAPAIRAVVLTGVGSVFCSGMDLKEAAESINRGEPEAGLADVADLQAYGDLIDQIHKFPRPVVAAVQGDALAGGAGLALACDFVVMASEAKLGYPEVKRGIVASVVMHDLVRLVGDRRARQLLLTGNPVNAATAHQWGLVNEIAASNAALTRAVEMAVSLCECAPQALATTKQLLDEATLRPNDLRGAAATSAALRRSDEATEGIRAFIEKRTLRWEITPEQLPHYPKGHE